MQGNSAAAHIQNGFDLLRVVAATVVIFGHAYPLAGQPEPGLLGNGIATLAVKVFFVSSGFLITRSWLGDSNAVRYAWRRILRIMPALVVTVLLTVLALGPIFTTLSVPAYFVEHGTWNYLRNIALYPVYSLPGLFNANTYPDAVNGSLWSLPAEVSMYLLVPLVVGRDAVAGRVMVVVVAAFAVGLDLYWVRVAPLRPSPVIYGTSLISLLDTAAYFQIGSLFAVFRLERYARPLGSLGLFAAVALVCAVLADRIGSASVQEALCLLVLPFAVVSLGWRRTTWLAAPLAAADLSYGLYLYGFPVQQAVAALGAKALPPLVQACIALPLALLLATVSWFVVERPALRRKPRRTVAAAVATA